ncbi:MAG TPA: succinylglutamate desuccinylase/aspartoacylase family protein [Candidatus Hydrogenedentes bacterium]|nr:succinylglutamate desuccinylase/aspartoacylase family protein [Candidatus Hydrogenedentota bacterium]
MTDARKDQRPSGARLKYSFLSILTGSDLSRRRLPMMSAASTNPGPVVWLTACGHGDEVGGMVAIQDVFKRLRKTPLLQGAVHAFPLMNPLGFETASRHITPTEEDLNRSFPGSRAGSLGERIAHRIFTTIMETRPALVLDLHNDWMKSVPYTLLDPFPGANHAAAYDVASDVSQAAGLLVVRDTDEAHRTLSYSLLRHDVPALTLELGGSYVVDERLTRIGRGVIWRILTHLGMTPPIEEPLDHTVPADLRDEFLRYVDTPIASTSGVIRFLVEPGRRVKHAQAVARTYNAFGKLQETLAAPGDGILLGHADSSVVFPGMRCMAFGCLQEQPTAEGTADRAAPLA